MKRKEADTATWNLCHYKEPEDEDAKWHRPALPEDFSAETHSIIFQQMDINYTIENERPVIKMYGCSQEGYSVALSIHHFQPYIYTPVPLKLNPDISRDDLCNHFKSALNTQIQLKNKAPVGISFVETVEILQKMPIMFYQESKTPFFKITFSSPKYVTQARSILESGLFVNGIESNLPYLTYESNIAYILRFMVDCGIGGASWLQLPAGKYRLITERRQCQTTVEASISYRDLIVYPVDDEDWGHIAPLRTVSFDIECAARPGTFPDPQIDPVIQIANYVSVHGQAKPILSNIFVLDICTPIIGVDVRSYRTEKELLFAWSSFMRIVDPDIITGYNIVNFDLDYLKKRAARLDIDDFDLFTRHKEKRISMKESKFSSAQTGTRESKEWFIDGRIIFDMYQVLQRDHKLSSYTLNNVSAHFLKEQKEDVHHSMISVLHRGTPDDRRRLAIYCCKDALLPQKLIDSLMCLVNYVEMARVTGVPFAYLLSRGQSIKVTSQILRKAMHMDILLPTTKAESNGQDSFEGAKVMDPVPGLYEEPIPTLDFSSLYPTIIQAHNLCYTTFIPLGIKIPDNVAYETTPIGERFVTNSQKPGILPLILTDLLNARGRAKKLMFDAEKAKDKFKVQVYNGRQLALKVSANSVYGFTGQAHSGWPCLQISSSVTAYGRQMIMLTKDIVEEHYSIKNGWHCDTRVIYGDTDSVMVSAGLPSVEAAIKMGKEAAAMVSKRFPSPIKLEFEKVYFPYLLMSKKKYAGLFWTKSDRYDKLDCKGIESVRRDNCGIVRHVVDTVLRKILIDRDRKAAEMFAKGVISDILQNKIDLSLLIITKGYKKTIDEYKATSKQKNTNRLCNQKKPSLPAHIVLAERLKLRNPATAPAVGDRIPYLVIQGDKKAKLKDHIEDPLYVLEHNIAIDTQYYIDQLIAPLGRLFGPMMENAEAFFMHGEHTTKKTMPIQHNKGLGSFFTKRESCLGCKVPLGVQEKTMCFYCRDKQEDIYMSHLSDSRQKEMAFNRLWTHCQQCQGNMHVEVICSASDCPIFYKRIKAMHDHRSSLANLSKFDLTW